MSNTKMKTDKTLCEYCARSCKEENKTLCTQFINSEFSPRNSVQQDNQEFKPDLKDKPFSEMTFREGVAFEFAKIFLKYDLSRIPHAIGEKEVVKNSINAADELIKALNEEDEQCCNDTFVDFLKLVEPVAKACGVSENDLSHIYKDMKRVGLNAEQAGTSIRNVILRLNKEKEPDKIIPVLFCSLCKKPRGDKDGILITPCPHCGDDIPF